MSLEDKKILDRKAAGKLLETLGKDIIEKGKVEISGIQVALPEIIEVELEYKEKHGRKKLEIELKWDHEATRTTSGVIPTEETPHVVKIATIDELSPGKVIDFAYPTNMDSAILIVLPDRELRAYSTVCPHKGKCVAWDDQLQKLHCPAHGAVFDPETGEKLSGPGDKSLTKIHLQIRENHVYAIGMAP